MPSCRSAQWNKSKFHRKVFCAWGNMRDRCRQPNHDGYANCGGRGIKVLYKSAYELLADVGLPPTLRHTLTRINAADHYRPGNCRWTTYLEQSQNPTKRSAVLLTYRGKTMSQRAWARHLGLREATISQRRTDGWPIEKVLSVGGATVSRTPCSSGREGHFP